MSKHLEESCQLLSDANRTVQRKKCERHWLTRLGCQGEPSGEVSHVETPFEIIIWHGKMHICAKYGHIIVNCVIDMAMILVIWLESHKYSYMIVYFKISKTTCLPFL